MNMARCSCSPKCNLESEHCLDLHGNYLAWKASVRLQALNSLFQSDNLTANFGPRDWETATKAKARGGVICQWPP